MAVGTLLNDLTAALADLPLGEVEIASGFAKESLLIRAAIENANDRIFQTAAKQPAFQGMGTTVVVAAFYNNRLSVAHVGDSRLYRYRDGRLTQMTMDHSAIYELVAKGYFKSIEEALAAGMKSNAITRGLGLDEHVLVDVQEDDVHENDIYLLCSDGLTDMVDDATIGATVHASQDLGECADRLVELANAHGGKDNVSVILIRPTTGGATHLADQDWLEFLEFEDDGDKPAPSPPLTSRNWLERITGWMGILFRKGS